MNNTKLQKNIFLGGGGEEDDSFLIDKNFVNSLPSGAKILYFPFASEQGYFGYESSYNWIVKCLGAHSNEFLDINMWSNFEGHSPDELDKYCAIYIGGGNTFRLLEKIYNYNFLEPLKKFIEKGGLLYGGSAGAIILGKDINTVSEENNFDYKKSTGLSELGKYSVICHYEEGMDNKIYSFVNDYNIPVIALSERAGLKIEGDYAQVVGHDPVVLFDKNNKKELVEQGVKFLYKNEN